MHPITVNSPKFLGCSRNRDPTWFDPASIEIDESNSGMREAHLGQRMLVKQEKPEVAIVPCAQLLFTQAKCSAQFKGGPYKNKHLNYFIHDLISKHPKESCELILKEKWLVLDIMKYNGRLWSIDNRRLHCLQEYQKYLQNSGRNETVQVRVRIHQWTTEHHRCLQHYDTRNRGTDIKVRGRWWQAPFLVLRAE